MFTRHSARNWLLFIYTEVDNSKIGRYIVPLLSKSVSSVVCSHHYDSCGGMCILVTSVSLVMLLCCIHRCQYLQTDQKMTAINGSEK